MDYKKKLQAETDQFNQERLFFECPDCGAKAGKECKPEYGCDQFMRMYQEDSQFTKRYQQCHTKR